MKHPRRRILTPVMMMRCMTAKSLSFLNSKLLSLFTVWQIRQSLGYGRRQRTSLTLVNDQTLPARHRLEDGSKVLLVRDGVICRNKNMELGARGTIHNVRMPQLVLLDNVARFCLAIEGSDTESGRPAAELAYPVRDSRIRHDDKHGCSIHQLDDIADECTYLYCLALYMPCESKK